MTPLRIAAASAIAIIAVAWGAVTALAVAIVAVATLALVRLWARDLLAGSFVTALLAALAITAGAPLLPALPVFLAAGWVCWREVRALEALHRGGPP